MAQTTTLTAEQLGNYRRLLTSPWRLFTRTSRAALRHLLEAAERQAQQHAEDTATGARPHTVMAVESSVTPTTAKATGILLAGAAAGHVLMPLSVTAGPNAVCVVVRPATLEQWTAWTTAIGARPGETIHRGSVSKAKGCRAGAPVVLIGYGVSALFVTDARAVR
ncbi:hypothetical protein [Kitasatospora sp. NPDC087315]|uniref:hypothetical protein n=1 Tax=Kitasatospora sp. NPDC087315 TaxID=3364069 RepID=UPI0038146AF8